MTRIVHAPYTVEQDDDSVWYASAQSSSRVAAAGGGKRPGSDSGQPAGRNGRTAHRRLPA